MPAATMDSEFRLLKFLRQLTASVEGAREADGVLRPCLRLIVDFFGASAGCVAVPAGDGCELTFAIPRDAAWDREMLTAFLDQRKPAVPGDTLVAPLRRHGRIAGAVAVRRGEGEFDRECVGSLLHITAAVSNVLDQIDHHRVAEVRARIDRKIMEELRPQDLFYQILHGLRALTGYDHSSALLVCSDDGQSLELMAEQLAWSKGKSQRIGSKLPLTAEVRDLMRAGGVYGFDRDRDGWLPRDDGGPVPLATLLDDRRQGGGAATAPHEGSLLVAPLATRDAPIGILKVAGTRPGMFAAFERGVLEQFTCQASVAIQYLQRTESLQHKMLEAEKKHAVANLARGVSHDVNNALGAVLPLAQQMLFDLRSGRVLPDVLIADLEQIEQSLQVCRRIFGGMLAFGRGTGRRVGQGNLRRAIDSTLAILKDGMVRQGITLDLHVPAELPMIPVGQADLEQLFLNLASNARDAMPTGGRLSIEATADGDAVVVVIADTGCGIPSEHLERIREPFFTTKPNGNGLGLSICSSIIWALHGDLRIDSRVGQGTRVRVSLPMAAVDERARVT